MNATKAINAPVGDVSEIKPFGQDTLSQFLTGLAILVILYLTLTLLEYFYNSFTRMWKDRVELFPDTYASGSKVNTVIQNPNSSLAKPISLSSNQRSGIELSYAMFLNISSVTQKNGDQGLYHILHKGYSKPYPLMGPGIFACGDKNTIRIFMNCYDSWLNYVDIDNIPIDMWFHLVVSCKGNILYVYVNGNLKSKTTLSNGTQPYQNYGDIYLFSPRTMTLSSSKTMSLAKDVLNNDSELVREPSGSARSLSFKGAATGMVSRVFYFAYALTYTEIQNLMNMGPSKKISSTDMNISPYMADTWWTNRDLMMPNVS